MAYGNTPPGWGGWAPPPPPRPGVIPLGPLGLGDLLGGAFNTLGRYWKQLFGIALTVYAAAILAVVAALGIAYALVSDDLERVYDTNAPSPGWDELRPLLLAFAVVWSTAALVMLLASAMVYAACPAVLQDAVLGRPTTFGTVWRRAWARVPAVIGTLFLTALLFLIPFALFVAAFVGLMFTLLSQDSASMILPPLAFIGALVTAPVGIWLWVKFSLAPAAAVFEGQGVIEAMRRSSRLVRGDWWRIFGVTVLAGMIAAAASYFIQLPVSFIGMLPGTLGTDELGPDPSAPQVLVTLGSLALVGMAAQLIGQIFVTTFPQLVTGLLYVDRRIRTENLAPVLAEAAAADRS